MVDFIRVYADRTHHGKEEDILFRHLRKKDLSNEDRRLMDDLIGEHIFSRETTRVLVEANTRYRKGDASALAEVTAQLQKLVGFYPKHIKKEDGVFFPTSLTYLSKEEDQAMLAEFWEFVPEDDPREVQGLSRRTWYTMKSHGPGGGQHSHRGRFETRLYKSSGNAIAEKSDA